MESRFQFTDGSVTKINLVQSSLLWSNLTWGLCSVTTSIGTKWLDQNIRSDFSLKTNCAFFSFSKILKYTNCFIDLLFLPIMF